jgi:hypothetical protein
VVSELVMKNSRFSRIRVCVEKHTMSGVRTGFEEIDWLVSELLLKITVDGSGSVRKFQAWCLMVLYGRLKIINLTCIFEGKSPTLPFIWPVTYVFQSETHWIQAQLFVVRAISYSHSLL